MKRRTLIKALIAAPVAVAIPAALAAQGSLPPEFSEIWPGKGKIVSDGGWQIVEFVTSRSGGKGGGVKHTRADEGLHVVRTETVYNYFAVHPDHNIAFNLENTGNRIDVDDLERRYAEVQAWQRLSKEEKAAWVWPGEHPQLG